MKLFAISFTIISVALALQNDFSVLPIPTTATPFGHRLSFGETPTSLRLTWSTTAPPLDDNPCIVLEEESSAAVQSSRKLSSIVVLKKQQARLICGTSTPFVEPSTGIISHFIHVVELINLQYSTQYKYWHPSSHRQSGFIGEFTAPPENNQNPLKFLLFGDMGVAHALTLPYLIKELKVQQQKPSFIIHAGDIAYDLAHYQGRKGQHFLKMIDPLSSSVLYMVAAGNHEAAFNFSHYKAFFRMPQWESTYNLQYSFDVGLLHVVVYNTEVFFWPEHFGAVHMQQVYDFLKTDLEKAVKNRKNIPWILVVGHRPMYCAATRRDYKCTWEAEASRRGIPTVCPHNNPRACHPTTTNITNNNKEKENSGWPIEELFEKYQVDVSVFGHVHDYERYAPVFNYTVDSAATTTVTVEDEHGDEKIVTYYTNPNATVHITSGAGGNSEMRIGLGLPPQGNCSETAPWCLFQSGFAPERGQGHDFSYSKVLVHNASHLQWFQFSATFNRTIDEWWIIKK